MRVLISGSTGFLGSYLIKRLNPPEVSKIIALKRSSSNTFRLNTELDHVVFYDIDKISIGQIFEEQNIDVVINTVTDYGRGKNQVFNIIDANMMFSLKLLDATIKSRVKYFLNTDTLLPKEINAYSLSKAHFVDWMKYFSNDFTKLINIKIESMYGLLDNKHQLIPWIIDQLNSNVESIDLTSGTQKRDYIYIYDVVTAFQKILEHLSGSGNFEEFEVGSGQSIQVKRVIDLIYSLIGKKQTLTTKLNYGQMQYRKNEILDIRANISKLRKLGWAPSIKLEDGIRHVVGEE